MDSLNSRKTERTHSVGSFSGTSPTKAGDKNKMGVAGGWESLTSSTKGHFQDEIAGHSSLLYQDHVFLLAKLTDHLFRFLS